MRTRADLLEALLVERYTPIPPHRIMPTLDEIEAAATAEEQAAQHLLDEASDVRATPNNTRPWTEPEVRYATRRRGRGYEVPARQAAVRLGRTVAGVQYVRSQQRGQG